MKDLAKCCEENLENFFFKNYLSEPKSIKRNFYVFIGMLKIICDIYISCRYSCVVLKNNNKLIGSPASV